MLLDAAINAMEADHPQMLVAMPCLKIMQRHPHCFVVALVKAGLVADATFSASYKIWHSRRRNFTKPNYKPEAINKSVVAKVRSSRSRDRNRLESGG